MTKSFSIRSGMRLPSMMNPDAMSPASPRRQSAMPKIDEEGIANQEKTISSLETTSELLASLITTSPLVDDDLTRLMYPAEEYGPKSKSEPEEPKKSSKISSKVSLPSPQTPAEWAASQISGRFRERLSLDGPRLFGSRSEISTPAPRSDPTHGVNNNEKITENLIVKSASNEVREDESSVGEKIWTALASTLCFGKTDAY